MKRNSSKTSKMRSPAFYRRRSALAGRLVAVALLLLLTPTSLAGGARKPSDLQMRLILENHRDFVNGLCVQHRNNYIALRNSKEARTFDSFFDIFVELNEIVALDLVGSQNQTSLQVFQRARVLGPPHDVLGTWNSDLQKGIGYLEEIDHCGALDLTNKLEALDGHILDGQNVLAAVQFWPNPLLPLAFLSPPPPMMEPKKVKILASSTARLSGSMTARGCVSGVAPAGAMVKVTVTCGASSQMIMVMADANCVWRACFDMTAPGNCLVKAEDGANATNSDQRVVSTC